MADSTACRTQPPRRAFGSEGGFVYLLLAYVTAVAMLILSASLLMRSNLELHNTQRSLEMQQAFWNAEGGLDTALQLLRANPACLDGVTPCPYTPLDKYKVGALITTPTGTYTYAIQTLGSELIPPDLEQLTKQITVTGTVNGTTRTVHATYGEQKKFSGVGSKYCFVLGNDPMGSTALAPDKYLQIQGDLRSETGARNVFELDEVKITGAISVGPSAPFERFPAWEVLYGVNPNPGNPTDYLNGVMKYADHPYPAVSVRESFSKAILSEPPQITTLNIRQWSDPALDPLAQSASLCARGLGSGMSTTRGIEVGKDKEIVIGDGDACDLTGPGDGKILLATDHIYLQDRGLFFSASGGKLKFTSPATVYLTGRRGPTTSGDAFWAMGYVIMGLPCGSYCGYGAHYQGKDTSLKAVQGALGTTAITDGVRLVVPQSAYDQRPVKDWEVHHQPTSGDLDDVRYYTDFELLGGEFAGSVWAPWSDAMLYVRPGTPPPIRPSRFIGKHTGLFGNKTAGNTITFQAGSSSSQQPITLTSWTSD